MKPLLAILLLALAVPCLAQDKFSYSVSLGISGPETLKGRIYSILSRELSKTEGVRISTTEADIHISVVVIYVEPVQLYAISWVVQWPLYPQAIKNLIQCQTFSDQPGYEDLLKQMVRVESHVLRTSGKLEESLQDIAGEIQRDEIDPMRAYRLKMLENTKRKR